MADERRQKRLPDVQPVTLDDWHRALGFHKCATCGAPIGNGIGFVWQGRNRWCEKCFWGEDSEDAITGVPAESGAPEKENTDADHRATDKAIEMYESGATEAAVAEGTGVSPAEGRAVADALYLGRDRATATRGGARRRA
jgi:hypothetical protein